MSFIPLNKMARSFFPMRNGIPQRRVKEPIQEDQLLRGYGLRRGCGMMSQEEIEENMILRERPLGKYLPSTEVVKLVSELTSLDFEKVLNSNTPTLLNFWAQWNQDSLDIIPRLEELARVYEGRLTITRINVDLRENENIIMRYGINGVPAYLLLNQGKVQDTASGNGPYDRKIGNMLKKYFQKH